MTRYEGSDIENDMRPPLVPRFQRNDQNQSFLKPSLGTESTGSLISNMDFSSFESRDDAEDAEDNISVFSSSSVFASDYDHDDVFVQKYLALKKKLRQTSTESLQMKVRIKQLKKTIETQNENAKNDRLALEAKIQENNDTISSLQGALSKIEMQAFTKDKQYSDQMMLLRTETEMQVDRIQRKETQKLIEVQDELAGVQSRLKATTERYEEEKLKNQSSAETLITLQNEFKHQKAEIIDKLQKKDVEILSLQRQREHSQKDCEQKNLEIQEIRNINSSLRDDLCKMNEKCNDYKEGMKFMSIDYVRSVEELNQLREKFSKYARHMDNVEKRFREEVKERSKLSKQLEKLSHAYVVTDNMLEQEKVKTKDLQERLAKVTQDLESEVKKSNRLGLDLELTSNSLESSRQQASQLKAVNEDLISEVQELKSGLTQAIVKVKNLSQKGMELETNLVTTMNDLKTEQEKNVNITSELKSLENRNEELTQNLQSTEIDLHNTRVTLNGVTDELNEKSHLVEKLSKGLEDERFLHDQSVKEKDEKIRSLSVQIEIIPSLQGKISCLEDESANLRDSLEKIESDYSTLEQNFEQEKEETEITLNDKDELISSLRKDYKSLESRYSTVFDSLVETEDKLQQTRENLNETNLLLEKRNAEFAPIETMLRQEIAKANRNLSMEKEKSLNLSRQLEEATFANSTANEKLNASSERISMLEDQLLNVERQLKNQESMCKDLNAQLDDERNNPLQKKLKVAKKMIQAEKDRYRAVLSQIDDQNEIIIRVEDELKRYQKELKITKEKLKSEKNEKVFHSSNVLQELYKDLEEERKTLRDEKDGLRGELKAQKALASSLALRLKVFESKDCAEKEFVEELKKHYELSSEYTKLTDENTILKNTIQKQNEASTQMSKQLASVEEQLNDFKMAMSNLKDHCMELEQEKKLLKDQIDGAKAKTSMSLYQELNGIDDEEQISVSFDDFSVAEIPAPRLVYGNYILDRASARDMSDGETEE